MKLQVSDSDLAQSRAVSVDHSEYRICSGCQDRAPSPDDGDAVSAMFVRPDLEVDGSCNLVPAGWNEYRTARQTHIIDSALQRRDVTRTALSLSRRP